MSSKWNYIFGTITIGVIIGGTIYAIKKSKDVEENENNAISLEEARKILEEKKKEEQSTPPAAEKVLIKDILNDGVSKNNIKMTDGPFFNVDGQTAYFKIKESKEIDGEEETLKFTSGIEEVKEESTDKEFKPTLVVPGEEDTDDHSDEVDGDPVYDKYERVDENIDGPRLTVEPLIDFHYFEEGIDPKEDKTLRHDPNSDEARHQYIRMELADWRPDNDVYRILIQLFEIPFIPNNDGDEILRTQIIDHKVQFYGWNSRWNKEVSFADVIFHYARAAEFNCGESVLYWVEYFLDYTDFEWDSTSEQFDRIVLRLNSHTYFNQERQTFGLFGLTREAMDQAILIASRNLDRSVTYEIEFNEFLKSCI